MASNKCCVCYDEEVGLKACGRCKSVFYCSQECQKIDWKTHKEKCKKKEIVKSKIHSVSLDVNSKNFELGLCEYCEQFREDMKKCRQCLSVLYCSKECQKLHWKLHRSYCLAKIAIKGSCSYTEDRNLCTEFETQSQEYELQNEKNLKHYNKLKKRELAELKKQWKEIQKFGFHRGRRTRKEELDAGRSPRYAVNSNDFKSAINEAKRKHTSSVIISDFRAIPMELSSQRHKKITLIAQIVSWHPEADRRGMFITDVNDVTSFVLFDYESMVNPQPYFYWSDINPGNYILIHQPYLRVFPDQFLGFVIENACDVDTLIVRPWLINRLGKYMLTLNVYNGHEPDEKEKSRCTGVTSVIIQ